MLATINRIVRDDAIQHAAYDRAFTADDYVIVIIGQLGFAYDGTTLHVCLLAPGRVAGPHVSVEADRLRVNRTLRERTAARRALAAGTLITSTSHFAEET